MKYLKQFETHVEYEAYTADTANFVRPNVSICKDRPNEVHYNPWLGVVAKYNVTSTSEPTNIVNNTSAFKSIEIDGIEQPSVVSTYTFNTTGEHTVTYILTNPTSIGASPFYQCTSLTSIDIPSGVTSIGLQAFYGCSGLTSCTIGSGVTSIGREAFRGCSGFTSITVNATTPPALSDVNAFTSTNNCPIYVPSESVDAYKAATNWSAYETRIQAIP